jgi:sugar-specific transcriptional regulator TrmB
VIQKQIEDEMNKKMVGRQELDVRFLESKQETFNYVLPIIQKLKKELYILSVGEPIPDAIFVSIVEAIRRGVDVKMLAETYNETNKELLQNWQKNGYHVRYLTKPSLDFTLTIHDGESCVVQIRREKEKEQRVGIAISNPGYTQAQRQYFLALWAKAKDI